MGERKMFLIVFEMFGTFYFPKSLVALKKIMQGYLYHSVLQRATVSRYVKGLLLAALQLKCNIPRGVERSVSIHALFHRIAG